MDRYAPDFAGFDGRDLTPFGYIELDPNTDFCDQIIPVEEVDPFAAVSIYPNPAADNLQISLGNMAAQAERVDIANLLGESLYSTSTQGRADINIPLEGLSNGVYIIRINGNSARKIVVAK